MRKSTIIFILVIVAAISTSSAFAAQTISAVLDVTGTGDNVIRLADNGAIGWSNGTTNYQMWEDNANRYFHIGRAGVGEEFTIANGDVLINSGHRIYFDGACCPGSTYVTQNSPNALSFIAGGTQVMAIANGNVGIGTNTPSQKMDVSGNIRLTGNIVSPNDICIGNC